MRFSSANPSQLGPEIIFDDFATENIAYALFLDNLAWSQERVRTEGVMGAGAGH
jgi:hypothetical protein